MKKLNLKYVIVLLAATVSFSSCVDDLNVTPINPQVTQTFLQDDVFAKVYASFSHTGQEGPAGKGDIEGLDEGRFSLVRCLWNCNELTTDEAICSWGDAEVVDLNKNSWTPNTQAFDGLYARLYFVVTISNHFLEQTVGMTDEKTIKQRAEVRFLRAMAYYYLMDNFGNVPFIDIITDVAPQQIKRKDLFYWIENELKTIEPELYEPRQGPYYRIDKAGCWLLLARLYLNGEVYTAVPASTGVAAIAGQTFWNEAAIYSHKVITSTYALSPVFKHLFMGDNAGVIDGSSVNTASQEIIFPFPADGIKTTSWGSSLFLIASTHTSGMDDWGTSEGWGGNRLRQTVTKAFFPSTILVSNKKDLTTGLTSSYKDDRALIYGYTDRTLSIPNIGKFKEGYSAIKFSNVRADGGLSHDVKFVDMDYPFMRKAEAYLIYAEAVLRGGAKVEGYEALTAMNELRTRAKAKLYTTVVLADILTERVREFFMEGYRRTDLIRFNKFGGATGYTWEWKGGEQAGKDFPVEYNLFPLPTNDLNANPNLDQNPGY
ncbi:MAG: RagB/SusD family nutrient uptake outer membrane protein [Paludibacter sp.]